MSVFEDLVVSVVPVVARLKVFMCEGSVCGSEVVEWSSVCVLLYVGVSESVVRRSYKSGDYEVVTVWVCVVVLVVL